ncbi:MAG: hypothetical protein SCH98_12100 [Deferrisomatales bacterium]|nr:hypothetical protein [Deferrisomatales bacterium]
MRKRSQAQKVVDRIADHFREGTIPAEEEWQVMEQIANAEIGTRGETSGDLAAGWVRIYREYGDGSRLHITWPFRPDLAGDKEPDDRNA